MPVGRRVRPGRHRRRQRARARWRRTRGRRTRRRRRRQDGLQFGGGFKQSRRRRHNRGGSSANRANAGANRSGSTANRGNGNGNRSGNNVGNGNRGNINTGDVNVNRNNVNIDVDGGYGNGCCNNGVRYPVAAGMAIGAMAVTTAAVVGSYYYALPSGCSTVVMNGATYSQCGSAYYQKTWQGNDVAYVVVNP